MDSYNKPLLWWAGVVVGSVAGVALFHLDWLIHFLFRDLLSVRLSRLSFRQRAAKGEADCEQHNHECYRKDSGDC